MLSDLSVLDAWHRLAFHIVRSLFIVWHSLAFHLRNEAWRNIVVNAVSFIWHSLMMLSFSCLVSACSAVMRMSKLAMQGWL